MVSTEPRQKATSDRASRLVRWLRAAGRAVWGSATAGPGLGRWRRQPVRVRMARRGISLLEVLLSMFILTVGLLGVAALIPVGRYDLNQAAQADRGSTVGRAAFREVQIRDYLDQDRWITHDNLATDPWFDFDDPDVWPLLSPLDAGNSVCIDPLFVSRNVQLSIDTATPLPDDWLGERFPYPLDNDPDPGYDSTAYPNPPRMTRLTLRAFPGGAFQISDVVADRVFRSQDDLVFDEFAADPDGRPVQSFDLTSTPQFLGNYSWLVTVSPVMGGAARMSSDRSEFTVSVVVIQNRVLLEPSAAIGDRIGTAPSERTVYADFIDNVGWRGGTVRLRLPVRDGDPNEAPAPAEQSDMPAVQPGQWIMLGAWLRDPMVFFPDATAATPTPTDLSLDRRAVFRWYQVTVANDLQYVDAANSVSGLPEWIQEVVISGADVWPVNEPFVNIYFDADEDTTYPTLHAVIVDGVVGVYEKTVQLRE